MYMYHIQKLHHTSFLYFMSYRRRMCRIVLFNYFFLFCSLLRNEKINRPGFYMLKVTRFFLEFSKAKTTKQDKKMYKYCDLLELYSA